MLFFIIILIKLSYLAEVEKVEINIPDEFLALTKIQSDNLAEFDYSAAGDYNIDNPQFDDDTEIKSIETVLDFAEIKEKLKQDPTLSTSVLNLCSNFLINVMKSHDLLRMDMNYADLVIEIQKCKRLYAEITTKEEEIKKKKDEEAKRQQAQAQQQPPPQQQQSASSDSLLAGPGTAGSGTAGSTGPPGSSDLSTSGTAGPATSGTAGPATLGSTGATE